MNKIFNTISIFVVIFILSLLTACPVDNAPSEKKDAKAPVFDIKVINKAVSGLEQDLTADLINGFIMKKIGDISFNAFSTQFYAKCDNTTTSQSGYDGYFFYLENKIYFEDTTDKIFYYQELNNLNETIYYKNSVSIFKMMEENEYKTAKKELTEASLPILKPMMKEVDSALGKTTYKINVNSINDIDITAFKKTNKVQIFNKDITSTTPSWMLVILGYLNVNGINLSNPTNIMTNLTIFDDYKNIKGFFTELFSTIVAFTTNFFDDDLVAKLSEVNSKYHNCYNDTDETNLLMIVYGDNWDEYPYRFYKDYKITTQERADKTLTEVVCLLYKYGDDFKFFLSTQDESKFTGIRKLLNEINTKIKTIEVPTL